MGKESREREEEGEMRDERIETMEVAGAREIEGRDRNKGR
jgi:hypothetical protein